MPACKASIRSNILKNNRTRLYKAAGGDWTVLTVENGLLRAGIGHPALGLPHFARLLLNACIRHSVSRILRMLCALTCGSSQGEHPA
jgi:hypothetical protein